MRLPVRISPGGFSHFLLRLRLRLRLRLAIAA
jgi:hypothetical protein